MDEYISREEALKQLSEAESNGVVPLGHYEQRHSDFEEAKRCIEDIPKADVQPVKHGCWLKRMSTSDSLKCSICGNNHEYETTYCPHCGRRMDLKDGDAE
jgi:hypothetical protein